MAERRPGCMAERHLQAGRRSPERRVMGAVLFFLCVCTAAAQGEGVLEATCPSGAGGCCNKPKAPTDVCGGGCAFSSDWVGEHAPYWTDILSELACLDSVGADVLEIGSFEGRSAAWFLGNLHVRSITCIDTFQGGEEQSILGNPRLAVLEETFDANMRAAGAGAGLLHKHKGASHEVLPRLMHEGRRYDLIYIDGSHATHSTMLDAVLGMHLARVGGVLIFDDYDNDALAAAIDSVVAAHVDFIEVIDQQRVAPRQFAFRKVREIHAHRLVNPETRPEMLKR